MAIAKLPRRDHLVDTKKGAFIEAILGNKGKDGLEAIAFARSFLFDAICTNSSYERDTATELLREAYGAVLNLPYTDALSYALEDQAVLENLHAGARMGKIDKLIARQNEEKSQDGVCR